MDCPSISGAVSTTCTQRFLVRGHYPANLQCCVGVLSRYRVWWTIGLAQCRLISQLRYPRLRVATLPRSVEVWGLHSLKETFWGQIAFPLFYLEIFTRTSIIIYSKYSTRFFIRVAYIGVFSSVLGRSLI